MLFVYSSSTNNHNRSKWVDRTNFDKNIKLIKIKLQGAVVRLEVNVRDLGGDLGQSGHTVLRNCGFWHFSTGREYGRRWSYRRTTRASVEKQRIHEIYLRFFNLIHQSYFFFTVASMVIQTLPNSIILSVQLYIATTRTTIVLFTICHVGMALVWPLQKW